jgi:N4-gp56 family major capsid protein
VTDTLGTLTPEAKAFYDRNLLERAMPILGLAKGGQARNIPQNSGNQVSYRRFNQINTSTTALTESVTPAASALSMTEITGTVAEYGNYVQVSDALNLLAIDRVITEATDVLGENGGQSVEEIIRAELVNGTSVNYPSTITARSSVGTTNLMTLTQVRKAVRTLMSNDARPFYGNRDDTGQGGLFMGFIHPRVWYDLIGDTTVINTFTYSDPDKLYTMKIPTLGQVAWIISTKAPIFTGGGSGGIDVYGTFIFGKDAYGVVNVAGTGKFKTIVKPLGSAGTADPLDQRASIGWKAWQLPKILNNNFMVRMEAAVSS